MLDSARASGERPTHVRHVIVGATTFAAFLMYLDRICLSQMVTNKQLQTDLHLNGSSVGTLLGVFFFAYALSQVPAGWLADRFTIRPLMSFFIGAWSLCTFMTGFATGIPSLMVARIGCGIAEAGAYPSSSKLVPRWIPILKRGRANGIISAGGRLGMAFAPFITAYVITSLGGWRTPGRVFGGVGIVFAIVYWFIFRDSPSEHPGVNQAERDLIARGSPQSTETTRPRTHWLRLIILLSRSRDMWAMCAYQALTNVGWGFLITLMPTFLREVKGLSEVAVGRMATVALMAGFVGNVAGGMFTDTMVRRYGLRLGRMIPMAITRIPAALAYLVCLKLNSAWGCVAMFALVAAMTDLGMPAAWGYAQDIGGRNVAAVFGWPNMFGNLGAAVTAKSLEWINAHYDPGHNYHASLIFLAVAFALSSVVALGIRADVKLEPEDEVPRGFDVVVDAKRFA